MKKRILKTISLIMALIISVCAFASCMDLDELEQMVDESSKDSSSKTDASENADEVTVLEWFESVQENDAVPFTLIEKAKTMLSDHEELFLENKKDGLDAYTDTTLEYKVLTKNIDKHGDKLMFLEEAYVLSIDETEIDENMIVSELHLVDADENSYYCLSLCAYDNIFEEDVVKVYALPIGETSFDNISGGTTLAIMLAGCYIEKIEK